MDDEADRVSRRAFLRVGVAGAAGLALGCDPEGDPDAGGSDAGGPFDAGGGSDGGPPDAGQDAGPARPALAIPRLDEGELLGGVRRFALEMRDGSAELLPGVTTTTAGYSADFLGPALQLRTGEEVEIAVTNRLGRVSTTHWHGMHVPADMDGGPHQPIADGETWTARFTVLNPASLCWFHPHAMGDPTEPHATSYQVWMGLAGLLWIRDDESDALALPSTYGVDDVPLVLQDRAFGDDGELLHLEDPTDPMGMRKGDRFLVNGVIDAAFAAPAQLVRFRVLNGSNARIYNLALVDAEGNDRELMQIGSDNGLLEAPVPLRRVVVSPGERVEIVVDLTGDEGGSLTLVSKNEELSASLYAGNFTRDAQDGQTNPLLTLDVGPATGAGVTALPGALTSIPRIAESEADRTRTWVLNVPNGAGEHLINGQAMDIARTDAEVPFGSTEIWEIQNATQMAHPFHVHGQPFQVLSRTGLAMDGVPDNELGWKDTVLLRSGETVRIIRRFEDFSDAAGHYMFHCHILEHEDRGMMGQFTIVP